MDGERGSGFDFRLITHIQPMNKKVGATSQYYSILLLFIILIIMRTKVRSSLFVLLKYIYATRTLMQPQYRIGVR